MDDNSRLSGETLVVDIYTATETDWGLTSPIIVFQDNQAAVLTPGVPFQENRAAIIAIAASLGFFIFILIVWITLAAIPHQSDVTVRLPTYR